MRWGYIGQGTVACCLWQLALPAAASLGEGASSANKQCEEARSEDTTSLLVRHLQLNERSPRTSGRTGPAASDTSPHQKEHRGGVASISNQPTSNSSMLGATGWTAVFADGVKRSKVVLMLIEISGLGALGLDRLYLGSTPAALFKACFGLTTWGLIFCISGRCFPLGFIVFGLVDGTLIVMNAMCHEKSINKFGMIAEFHESELRMAYYLGILQVIVWIVSAMSFCSFSKIQSTLEIQGHSRQHATGPLPPSLGGLPSPKVSL